MNESTPHVSAEDPRLAVAEAMAAMRKRIAEAKGLNLQRALARTPQEQQAAVLELTRVEAEWAVAFHRYRAARHSLAGVGESLGA